MEDAPENLSFLSNIERSRQRSQGRFPSLVIY